MHVANKSMVQILQQITIYVIFIEFPTLSDCNSLWIRHSLDSLKLTCKIVGACFYHKYCVLPQQ